MSVAMLAALRALRVLACAGAIALTGGCATIMHGTTQDVQVATDPAGAACELRSKEGNVIDAIPSTPGYVRVRKGLDTYTVDCRAEGFVPATAVLDSGIEGTSVGGMTWGAFSGLQGLATGSTVGTMALSTVMPAATAAAAALWLGVVGAVSFIVDLATGAVFEFPAYLTLTLVPSSFASPVARDEFFDREEKRLRDRHAMRRKEVVTACRISCAGAGAAADAGLERDIAELERMRASARIAG